MKLVNRNTWIFRFPPTFPYTKANFAFPFFQFVIAALLAVAAAAPSSYKPEYKAPEITIVSQSDVRNLDGSGAWR
jgi:hypothetical protein